MLSHTVIFWLKRGLSENEINLFKEGVNKLGEISSVENFFLGSPAATPKRPVVDDTYDFAVTVVLNDMKAHDHYQSDPIHLEFIENCKGFWERVLIYDAD